jgi:isopenicillin-N epimerase
VIPLIDYSAYFPHKDPSYLNFNAGTMAVSPSPVLEAQIREMYLVEQNPTLGFNSAWPKIWQTHVKLGTFLKARPQDLFLRPNVTLVLNDLILGLQIPSGSEFWASNYEYGAVANIAKLKCQRENLSYNEMDLSWLITDSYDENQCADRICASIPDSAKVVLLSHVFMGLGVKLPIGLIAKNLRKRGIFLIVDGAQAPGLFDVDFQNDLSEVDFYGGNIHKWLMGPKGSAFGHVRHEMKSLIDIPYGSWTQPDCLQSLKNFGGDDFARRSLWAHSQNFPSYHAIDATLDFWNSQGHETLREQIKVRAMNFEDILKEKGLEPLISAKNNLGSSLLCYEIKNPKVLPPQGYMIRISGLKPLQVNFPKIPGRRVLRVTAHIHISNEEITQAGTILGEYLTPLSTL